MKCKTLHKKLIFFLENDLPEREAEEIKEHLNECPECRAFAEYMQQTLSVLQKEKSPEVNPFFYTRLKARMESRESLPKLNVQEKVWIKILQPAFFTLLLLAGIYTGIKIGGAAQTDVKYNSYSESEIFSYLDEMQSEPIETFLME
jgi:predicted anti-sigma-YlaC factor YlaD